MAVGQGGLKSHSSMQVLEMKEPSPFSGLRGEGRWVWKSRQAGPRRSRSGSNLLSGELSGAEFHLPSLPQHRQPNNDVFLERTLGVPSCAQPLYQIVKFSHYPHPRVLPLQSFDGDGLRSRQESRVIRQRDGPEHWASREGENGARGLGW